MIDVRSFNAGLLRIATATRQALDEATCEVYFEALEEETSPDEWEAFCRVMAKAVPWVNDGRAWFPQLPELLDALHEFRGLPPVRVEAMQAYQRTLAAFQYTPEAGEFWTYRGVLQACGRATADAFLAAGGPNAFATNWDETKRRQRFLDSYIQIARVLPNTRLLPAAVPAGLLAAADQVVEVEASPAEIIRAIQEHAPDVALPTPPRPALTDEEWQGRVRALKRQADELLAAEAKP